MVESQLLQTTCFSWRSVFTRKRSANERTWLAVSAILTYRCLLASIDLLSLSGTTGGGQEYRRFSSAIDARVHAGWREANTPNSQLGIWANPYTLHSNSHPIVFEGYRSM